MATDGHYGIAPEILAALPGLEIVASYGVGYDAIDTAACKARGVRATNTPDVLNDAVAELAARPDARPLPAHPAGRRPRPRRARGSTGGFGLTGELTGAHAGILGLGRIGKEIARRLQAMKMRVSYHGRHEQPYEPYVFYPDLEAMARDVDWLVVIAPGSAATRGIVSRAGARGARPRGRASSTSPAARWSTRPPWSSSSSTGRLGGAALDVFADEPRVPEALLAPAQRRALAAPGLGDRARPAPPWATSWCATWRRISPATRC